MKKTFSKILAGISVLFSVIFGVGSAFVLVDNVLGGTNVNAQNEESDIHSVTDITVDNVNEKIEEIKNIDSEDLEYNQELTEICEDDAFFDDDGSVYIYDENGNLITYIESSCDKESNVKISKQKAIGYAGEYLEALVCEKTKYVLQDSYYDSDTNSYSIVYGNQNNGIRTTDIVYLTIDGSGQLVGYSTPNIGEFDNVNLTNIVIEEAKKEALGKYVLKGDFDSTNDLVATNAVLTKKDNQF